MSASLGLKGRKAVVLGINPSGVELVKFLVRKGAEVVLADSKSAESTKEFVEENLDVSKVQIESGDYNVKTFEGAALVIVASGIPLDLPVLEAARTAGVQVVTEIEFVSLYSETPLIAVAGTNGKSTTAYLIEKMLEASGKKALSNVSLPLARHLNLTQPVDFLVAVSTSFQLEGTRSFKPKAVVFTNFSEDHLDKYPNIETYYAANREVFKNSCSQTLHVVNGMNPQVQQMIQGVAGNFVPFFTETLLPAGINGATGTRLEITFRTATTDGVEKISTLDLKNFRLRGAHNRENLMAASLVALGLGVTIEQIQSVVETIRALPHRLEFVKRLNSVAFYDDSCASNPVATIQSLQAFTEPVILIAGGRDKNLVYEGLAPHIRQRVKNLILVGEAKEKINRYIGDFTETFLVGTIEEAVIVAYQKSRSGDVILLSPACAPNDQFASHDLKGDYFKDLIGQIAQPRRPNVL
ncbi:MAG: UDP-N-acetylmuramoyl-L-alanine--D-glutamate ligase [Bdellovibrionota bacterium]